MLNIMIDMLLLTFFVQGKSQRPIERIIKTDKNILYQFDIQQYTILKKSVFIRI